MITLALCSACSRRPAPASPAPQAVAVAGPNPLRDAYFGDLHVHTRFSSDAFIFNTRATPDDAYRYAKGEPIQHAGGFAVQVTGEPLDFLAVTDHGEYLGVFSSFTEENNPLAKMPFAQRVLQATDAPEIRATFQAMRQLRLSGQLQKELAGWQPIHQSAWQEVIAAADRHYQPGRSPPSSATSTPRPPSRRTSTAT
jgi:hypothetical protein